MDKLIFKIIVTHNYIACLGALMEERHVNIGGLYNFFIALKKALETVPHVNIWSCVEELNVILVTNS